MSVGVRSIFSILISVLIIGGLIWFIIYPEPIKYILTAIYPNPEYKANENAKITDTTTIYSNPNTKHENLVIIFIGGCGLYSKMSNFYGFANKLNEDLGLDYDILLFQYPVRFKNTILESMLAINTILLDYIHYKTIHAVGISFGGLLAGAFYQKETSLEKSKVMHVPQIGMKFDTLSIFSGVFECTFNVKILTKCFNYYIMKNTPGIINYTCYGITIPKFVVSSNSDFLYSQTMKFLDTNDCQYKIYESNKLRHAFCRYTNLDETIDAITKLKNFINDFSLQQQQKQQQQKQQQQQ